MGVDRKLIGVLAEAGNQDWARNTWRKHATAEGHIKRYEKEVGRSLNFPFTKVDTLNYVGYLLRRGVKGDTISSYVSSIRAAHIFRGYCCPALRDELVTAVINGARNRDLGDTRAPRLAMTPALMREFKERIKVEKMSLYDKRLLWCVAVFSFWGSLRVHKILSVKPDEFTPDKTMVWSDVRLDKLDLEGRQVEVVRLRIRNPKESKSQHTTQFVELVETKGWMCPVNAFRALEQMKSRKVGQMSPLCRRKDGSLLTGRILNKLLEEHLRGKADYLGGKVSSHSFRAGLATALARLGYEEEAIKAMGRWKSDAYMLYVKRGRVGNLRAQQEMFGKIMAGARGRAGNQ